MIRQTIWGFKLLNIFQNFSYWRTCKLKIISFYFFFFFFTKESDWVFARTKNASCFLIDIRKKIVWIYQIGKSSELYCRESTCYLRSSHMHAQNDTPTIVRPVELHSLTTPESEAWCPCPVPQHTILQSVAVTPGATQAVCCRWLCLALQKGMGLWCSSMDQGCLLRKHTAQPQPRDLVFSPPEEHLSSHLVMWVFAVSGPQRWWGEGAGLILPFLQFRGGGAREVCSTSSGPEGSPQQPRATVGERKAAPSLTAGLRPTPVPTKEFSAFQDSCFPECQLWGKPLFSRESDTLPGGISPIGPISAWPTYLLMLTCGRGWESLALFELSMNKNNSASQAWNDFEWNPGSSQAIKWMGYYLVFCPTDAHFYHLNMTLLFPCLFRHILCSTRKEGLKGEVDTADLSKNFLMLLSARACFLGLQTFRFWGRSLEFSMSGLFFKLIWA